MAVDLFLRTAYKPAVGASLLAELTPMAMGVLPAAPPGPAVPFPLPGGHVPATPGACEGPVLSTIRWGEAQGPHTHLPETDASNLAWGNAHRQAGRDGVNADFNSTGWNGSAMIEPAAAAGGILAMRDLAGPLSGGLRPDDDRLSQTMDNYGLRLRQVVEEYQRAVLNCFQMYGQNPVLLTLCLQHLNQKLQEFMNRLKMGLETAIFGKKGTRIPDWVRELLGGGSRPEGGYIGPPATDPAAPGLVEDPFLVNPPWLPGRLDVGGPRPFRVIR